MGRNEERRILARGLNPPGPLLVVKKELETTDAVKLRVVVSSERAALEIQEYFRDRSAEAEIDMAGDDYHVMIDLEHFEGEE